ncbi:MAG: threonine--tRNA ligase [Candidatus Buchananbacteria bacterium CG10_big_fil_rev_8_21_14_0_10_42_9]|uniref:Threonine--tRNA ligase n=1 Tax=Candidatus Buchananbacteria bacterium CG10_big_fil_rev_8_21_14_0_10_42_9 TaxID=1974526 RepID=A0A2H0W2R7_9BACT|nr:MAG: threonine--tRNA ligase [Candidatus Buchananbacteria bacterium CG10_big_fil_rev_8_21_14_0_10_42_9]
MPKVKDSLEAKRHSMAHLLAAAVLELYPKAKPTIGPAIDDGFYYDFDFGGEVITEQDLAKIEKRMKKIAEQNHEITGETVSLKEAKKRVSGNEYKLELIDEFKKEGAKELSFYTLGKFIDLCRGNHAPNTKDLGSFHLHKLAGSYWRGDENNKMLTRIYGLGFATQKELDKHLAMLAEAKKRDHRKLGVELDLFTFSDLVGSGLPLFTPKGTILREEIKSFLLAEQKHYGYQPVWISHIAKRELYETSGHWQKFADEIFKVTGKSGAQFVLKPMNCPHHAQIYASRQRSYRDLPIRYSGITSMYRDEKPGQLMGLTRVRAITVDDGHNFCRLDQVKDEAKAIYEIIKEFFRPLNMPFRVQLSVRDMAHKEKYLGKDKDWDKAEQLLEDMLKEANLKYERVEGEAAFYGPKIDFMFTDAIGREWQLSTIQIDFNQPERFNLTYIDEQGKEQRPVIIHRAIAGSLERFLAVLIEHYAGAFPTWLAPVQIVVIPVGADHKAFAHGLAKEFIDHNLRVEVYDANETVGNKIRKAEQQNIPYMLVVGDKEMKSSKLHVRKRGEDKVKAIAKEAFLKSIRKEIDDRKSD